MFTILIISLFRFYSDFTIFNNHYVQHTGTHSMLCRSQPPKEEQPNLSSAGKHHPYKNEEQRTDWCDESRE